MKKNVIIAIDGPAGAGKSTIARSLARRLGYIYIDTGAMYRAVALLALRAGIELNDPFRMVPVARHAQIEFGREGAVLLNGEDVTGAIREPQISSAASQVAAIPGVREAMRDEQRRIVGTTSVVMEGRDIGTVVFPEAQIKIFLDAEPHVRASRRADEIGADPEHVARELAERDQRDRGRNTAPLLQAPDADYIDSTGLTLEQVEEAILKIVRARTSNGQAHA